MPFKSKSNDPVINCEDDDILILNDEKCLADYHIGSFIIIIYNYFIFEIKQSYYVFLVNETEISYFCMADYQEYKSNKIITLTW